MDEGFESKVFGGEKCLQRHRGCAVEGAGGRGNGGGGSSAKEHPAAAPPGGILLTLNAARPFWTL